MMLRSVLFIGALAAGVTFGGLVSMPSATTADLSAVSSSGCLGETQTWLPGALQIEGQAGMSPPNVGGGTSIRATAQPDCALV